MEGLGLDRATLILLNSSFLFYYLGIRVFYFGGSSLYGGKGAKYPYNPDLFGLLVFHLFSWGNILNLGSLIFF
jgi:hypothetical protein